MLILLSGSLFFPGMDAPLLEPQESRYAEIPREMLERNDWIVPHLNGRAYLDKPPLLYWITALSYSIFGVDDASARLAPALAALATVLITFLWGCRIAGPGAGFAAGAILALSASFVYRGRWLSFDALLCLWTTTALAAAHAAATSPRFWPWWLLSALAAGLGLLTKGPVVFVLVGVPLFAARWVLPARGEVSIQRCIAWTIVACAVALPWFRAMSERQPDFIEYFFWKHHVERYVTPFDHQKPFWFYIPELVVGMTPWVALLPGLARWRRKAGFSKSDGTLASARFAALAGLWCVLFFSFSGSKRATYILPCFPPLALALGLDLASALSRTAQLRWFRCGALVWLVLFGLVVFWWPFYTRKFSLHNALAPAAECLPEGAAVVSYPRMWDGVSYYLRRSDVRVYGGGELGAMLADIEGSPSTLVLVKPSLAGELLTNLPANYNEREVGRNTEVVAISITRK